jgi:simple sugar transport system ATP-binding protein
MAAAPLLSLRAITKSFHGVRANDRVDLDIYPGEVHALVGENGAGKSTLVKILYGFYRADSGDILHEGVPARIDSPKDARRLGIGMVFQELVQIPALTVGENIALFLPHPPAVLSGAVVAGRIAEASDRYGLAVAAAAPLGRLSMGERQRVEIVKLLLAESRVLILDEPTRGLAPHEVERLLETLGHLRRDGYAVVLITHKLSEVLACADRITVMRRGMVAGRLARDEASEAALVSLMFESPVLEPPSGAARPVEPAAPVLELRGVRTRPVGWGMGLHDIDLVIRSGEIVGVAGVAGNGQRELGDVILGLAPLAGGRLTLAGHDVTGASVRAIRSAGVVFIPEDALGLAGVGSLTVLENMVLGDTRRYARAGGLGIDWAGARADLERSLERLGVTVGSPDRLLGALSGGNVQRVILARELASHPRLIVAFYPTRGLDARSAVAARALLRRARAAGAGVLLVSEDLGELFALADRLVVLFRGRIAGAGVPGALTVEEVGYLMTGGGPTPRD